MSEIPGQSGRALPGLRPPVCAIGGHAEINESILFRPPSEGCSPPYCPNSQIKLHPQPVRFIAGPGAALSVLGWTRCMNAKIPKRANNALRDRESVLTP